ncbi:nitrogen fixation protein NifQ [Photobacterium sp. ZSDE20]|uniref:Nitrogen fixation protein NifQ n=1 Tax=Photobacterium pectinilyticum TaxID=2906793 RepID=A0ABT1N1G8_9GAMM|nr:nitrogen fixation protein NifQ [Photobacterium sp. ZSDE20]MCQ1058582.1 nitrogen fixation protein NifQ [Photobacterium sp. ZSDE20]MDD1826297.1 nitrogen fixation protein NifQ [Photobacterium sp. ZSDE20]
MNKLTPPQPHKVTLSRLWRSIYTRYLQGKSALPPTFGITQEAFENIVLDFDLEQGSLLSEQPVLTEQAKLRGTLLKSREEEWLTLHSLFTPHINPKELHAEHFCKVLAAACLGQQHLWKDLGMDCRQDLSTLISIYLPTLHTMNIKNMRWKRFFYLQLCQAGGDYVCRAPSCEACSSRSECFIDDV